jgi:hypothetical protein
MFHVTSSGSGYFENVWAWSADHDIDDPKETQVNVITGRGILIESNGPAWFYGTASEHSVLYQYNLANAENIFMGMVCSGSLEATFIHLFAFLKLMNTHILTDSNRKPLLLTTYYFSFPIQRTSLRR